MPCPHFGNYPKEYNRAVHGNYNPGAYYGKADKALSEVKVSELFQWLNRRNLHPSALIRGLSRAYHRYEIRFVHPRYSSAMISFNQKMICMSLIFYVLLYPKTIRHHKQFKHHW